MRNTLLVMAATGDFLFAAGNVLLGLKKYSPNMFDHIIIYTDDTAKECDKKALSKIFDVEFKIYDFQLDSEEDKKRLSYYSNMPYARFEMLTYLNEYNKVIWFDSDFLITGDVIGLLDYGDKTGFSMAIDLYPYPKGHSINAFFVKPVPGYDMSAKAYASGLVIFSNKLQNPLELRDYLYKKINQYSSYTKYAEQGILHLMAQDYNIEIEEFPKLIYHAFPDDDKSNAKIIHLLGGEKPWNTYMYGAYDEWYDNHKKWIELGGSECKFFKELLSYRPYKQVFYGEKRYQNILQKYAYNSIVSKINNLDYRMQVQEFKPTFKQKIFSVRDSVDRKHKIITILGIKINLRQS